MATTIDSGLHADQTPDSGHTGVGLPVTTGAVLGGAAVGCCSVGIGSGMAVGLGVGSGFFALNEISPVGDRPVLFFGALLVAAAVAWLVARRQTRGLPSPASAAATRRLVGAAAFATAGSWFVIMQIVIPVMFVFGWADMGQWFPRG
jgi:hypothetical protein